MADDAKPVDALHWFARASAWSYWRVRWAVICDSALVGALV
jgi:hypothetical protein